MHFEVELFDFFSQKFLQKTLNLKDRNREMFSRSESEYNFDESQQLSQLSRKFDF